MRFEGPLLAYSDHPLVLWPVNLQSSAPFSRQGVAPISSLEIRVPIAPDAALLMTWMDRSDETLVALGPRAAAELNAFTVGQADRQWMQMPGNEPQAPRGSFTPLSRLIDPAYDRDAHARSARRATAMRFMDRVKDRRHVHDVEVVIDGAALHAPAV